MGNCVKSLIWRSREGGYIFIRLWLFIEEAQSWNELSLRGEPCLEPMLAYDNNNKLNNHKPMHTMQAFMMLVNLILVVFNSVKDHMPLLGSQCESMNVFLDLCSSVKLLIA